MKGDKGTRKEADEEGNQEMEEERRTKGSQSVFLLLSICPGGPVENKHVSMAT